MSDQTKDLAQLAAGAHREAESQLKVPPPKKPLLGGSAATLIYAVIAAVVVIAAYGATGPYLLGYSDHTLRKELAAVVAAARNDIEAARKQSGALPAAIPSMALAMVVEYHRSGDGYRLVAKDGVRVVSMDDKGQVSDSTGNR